MRAVVFEDYGGPEVLTVHAEHPKATRRAGEVMVKVVSTSVNPVDWKTRSGQVPRMLCKLPKVLGGDVAGVVIDSDCESRFKRGDRVMACTDGFKLWRQDGCYCEYVSVPEDQLAMVPSNLPLEAAGGLPLVCLTAWKALDAANLSPGQRLLIQAGAGGIGSICIQMAKERGLEVVTTCSTRNISLCHSLGATQVIDYTSQTFEQVLQDRPVHAIIDLIGGEVELRSMQILSKTGVFVCVLNSGWIRDRGLATAGLYQTWYLIKGKLLASLGFGPRYELVTCGPNGAQLAEIATLFEAGKLRPVIDHVLPLEQAAEGHAYLEQGHAHGKVILKVADEAFIMQEINSSS